MNKDKEEAREEIITATRKIAGHVLIDEVFEEAYEAGLAQGRREAEVWKRRAEQARERLHAVVNEHAAYMEELREESSAVHRPH